MFFEKFATIVVVRRFAVLCLTTASAALSCSLFVDTDGFDGDPADASPVDAREDESAVAIADVATEAIADASTEACTATFCDDFDKGDLVSKWTTVFVAPTTTLSQDTSAAYSAPRSLRATVPEAGSDTTSTGVETYVERVFDENPKSIRCEFRARVERGPSLYHKDIFHIIATGLPYEAYKLRFSVRPDSTSIREDINLTDGGCECPRDEIDLPELKTGTWMKVSIETDFTMTTSVRIDDIVVFKGAAGGFTPQKLSVRLGLQSYRPDPAIDVRFDDFSCNVTR